MLQKYIISILKSILFNRWFFQTLKIESCDPASFFVWNILPQMPALKKDEDVKKEEGLEF